MSRDGERTDLEHLSGVEAGVNEYIRVPPTLEQAERDLKGAREGLLCSAWRFIGRRADVEHGDAFVSWDGLDDAVTYYAEALDDFEEAVTNESDA